MSLTSANKVETNKYELEIRVDGDTFKKALDHAYRTNIAKMSVPGFRKGKAPKSVVEKMYGEGVFLEDAVNATYGAAYEAAIDEANIEPVDRAEIEVLDVNKEGYSFKATVIVKPEVTIENYKGIKATKKTATVLDADVDAEIAKLRERNGRMVNVEDRAAANGDSVVFDFEGFVDGEAFEGGKAEKFSLTLGSGQFIPGFEEQIVGHNIGEDFDVNVTFPEDYQAEELAGKASVFKCKIHEIKARELAELDDEFAKDVSEFDTLDELKADMKAKLQERADKMSQDDVENQLIDAVVANLNGDIPEVMYEHKVSDLVSDFEQRLKMQGLDLATYLQYTGMEMDSFRKTFREQAERQVKVRLALEKIAEVENLTATEEELEAEYTKIAESYKMEIEKVKSFIPAVELAKDVKANKAIDLVRDNAEISEESLDEEAAEKKPAPKKRAPRKKKEETAE